MLQISKFYLINIQAIQWAKSGVGEKAKEKSEFDEGKILRSKLGPALHLIRFSTMSAKEFAESVGQFRNKNKFKFMSRNKIFHFSSIWGTYCRREFGRHVNFHWTETSWRADRQNKFAERKRRQVNN